MILKEGFKIEDNKKTIKTIKQRESEREKEKKYYELIILNLYFFLCSYSVNPCPLPVTPTRPSTASGDVNKLCFFVVGAVANFIFFFSVYQKNRN